MKLLVWVLLFGLLALSFKTASAQQASQQYFDDDDDFSDFDMEDGVVPEKVSDKKVHPKAADAGEELPQQEEQDEPQLVMAQAENDADEAHVEAEDDNAHFNDEEEFIGFSSESSPPSQGNSKKDGLKQPKLNIANVPLHLRSNWDSFYMEMLLVLIIVLYFTNFTMGRNKNFKMANSWFEAHKTLLTQQFALVGDDGKAAADSGNASNGTVPAESKSVITTKGGCAGIQKESENIYSLYCSGRMSVHSMMVELKFIKRQDLASLIAHVFRPTNDEIVIKLRLDDMDSFVMCISSKKMATKYAKEMADITTYCPGDRKVQLPSKIYTNNAAQKFVVFSEIGEACQYILGEQAVSSVLNKFLPRLNYLHISDQYSGQKPSEQEQQMVERSEIQKMAEVHKTIVLSFQVGEVKGEGKSSLSPEDNMESLRPLLMLSLHLADKLQRFKLSKEAKAKAKRNRTKVEEAFHKASHAARAERAQELKEEKRREIREKIMESDDVEKQRKWEERENRRAAKKKLPKVKQLKIA